MRLDLDVVATLFAVIALVIAISANVLALRAGRESTPRRLRDLESDLRGLQTEFASDFDKIQQLMLRMAKREQRARKGDGEALEPTPGEPALPNIGSTPSAVAEHKAALRRHFGLTRLPPRERVG